jgi:hypothetical protein
MAAGDAAGPGTSPSAGRRPRYAVRGRAATVGRIGRVSRHHGATTSRSDPSHLVTLPTSTRRTVPARRVRSTRATAIVAHAAIAVALALCVVPARAVERTVSEFWPELDVFVKLGDRTRLFLLGTFTRAAETGTSTEGTLGAHLDWFPAGLPTRLLEIAPGMEGRWSLWTRIGYQHVNAWNSATPSEDRGVLEATLRSEPLWQSIRLANRSRLDLRAVGGETSWRYRNRSRIERTWALRGDDARTDALLSYLPPGMFSAATPYWMIEFFWDSRDGAWSRRYQQFGLEFEMARERTIDVFLARQDDLRLAGSKILVSGVALTLRF